MSGSQICVHKKWPNQIFPKMNFFFSHNGHSGGSGHNHHFHCNSVGVLRLCTGRRCWYIWWVGRGGGGSYGCQPF